MRDDVTLSVVIPLYNEVENIEALLASISAALKTIPHEIICVDDGSADGTSDAVRKLHPANVTLIELTRNFGQSAALAAGIRNARGKHIATMDGDGQNDPADITDMLQKLQDEKLDLVVGWRKQRQDGLWLRRIPSIIANRLIRIATATDVHDHGCTLKVMDGALAKSIPIKGEMHRFIVVLARMQGARIGEMQVRHHPRRFGVSKYGIDRTLRVLCDLVLLWFLTRYRHRPMHAFGAVGFTLIAAGLISTVCGQIVVGVVAILVGLQFIGAGLIAELIGWKSAATATDDTYLIRTSTVFSKHDS